MGKVKNTGAVLWRMFKSFFLMLIAGLVGGCIAPILVGWFCPQWGADYLFGRTVLSGGDAVSIANTYIVFTTLFFVGVTVLLAFGTMELTRNFNQDKEDRLIRLIEDDLIPKLMDDGEFGKKFAAALFKNPKFGDALRDGVEGATSRFLAGKGIQTPDAVGDIRNEIEG